MKLSIKKKLYFYIGLSLVVSAVLSSGIFLYRYYEEVNASINEKLQICASLVKSEEKAPSLELMRSEGFEASPEYISHLNDLKKVNDVFGFKYIYIVVKENGTYIFTYDTGNTEGSDDFESTFLTEYTDTPPQLGKAFETGTMQFAEYTDKWGDFRSVFLPMTDSEGKVTAVIGADYSMISVKKKLSRINFVILGIAALIILILVAVVFLLKMNILKPILFMIEDVTAITENADLTLRSRITSNDEIGTLSGHFNSYIERTAGIVGQIGNVADGLTQASAELEEISKNFQDTTQDQVANSHETVKTLEKITAMINSISSLSTEQLEIFVSQKKLIGDLYSGITAVTGQTEKT
ncbi:MAG: hypothetical protein ACRCUT_05315, partial [Spirochaetota bacterium]